MEAAKELGSGRMASESAPKKVRHCLDPEESSRYKIREQKFLFFIIEKEITS